ncbi:polymerase [Halomonas litopenaei]|uniref:Polymerase n=2 Tax=Halomonadaceae TaxID=28256 RepID=A0ABX5IS33_9GAMM|nr:polymerase [Halomonas sp. SYSU XM8]PTL88761.1 polymerase [Halomonas litopenaei]
MAGIFLVLTFFYSSFRICLPDIGQKSGTAIALVALFVIFWTRSSLRKNTVFLCLLGVVTVQLVSWMAGYFHHPDWLPDNPELDRLGKWFLFVGVAFWLGGMRRNTETLLLFALLGFLAACFLFQGAADEWLRGLKGQRMDLGIRNAQHTSMFFGVAVIGLLCFSRRFFLSNKCPLVMGPIWIVVFCICLLGVLITQTRAVWLSLVFTLLIFIAIFIVAVLTGRASRSLRRQGVIVVLCMVVVAGTGGLVFKDTLGQRIAAEKSVMANAWQGNWEEVPYSSIGNRLHTWRAGVEWILERPIVGWGGDGRGLVIDHTVWLPRWVKNEYGHLHSTLLDFLVSYGFLGLSVILVLVIWTGLGSWKAWRAGVMPTEVFAFGWAFFVYYFIVSLFESYSFFWTGSYIQNVVMGVVVTFIWRWQLESGKSVFPGRKKLTS